MRKSSTILLAKVIIINFKPYLARKPCNAFRGIGPSCVFILYQKTSTPINRTNFKSLGNIQSFIN